MITNNINEALFNKKGIKIYKELDNTYSFDINNILHTRDITEAVCYLMKNGSNKDEFWNYEIN